MPCKERSIVEERMRFVLRLKDGEWHVLVVPGVWYLPGDRL